MQTDAGDECKHFEGRSVQLLCFAVKMASTSANLFVNPAVRLQERLYGFSIFQRQYRKSSSIVVKYYKCNQKSG